jgi:hypothetical protein
LPAENGIVLDLNLLGETIEFTPIGSQSSIVAAGGATLIKIYGLMAVMKCVPLDS